MLLKLMDADVFGGSHALAKPAGPLGLHFLVRKIAWHHNMKLAKLPVLSTS
jgi:hypothetical protein